MGSMISSFFRTGGHLLSSGISESTRQTVLALLEEMRQRENSHIHWSAIESFLVHIPKGENILAVTAPDGYNLLQRAIGFNCVELVRWILNRGCDVNRGGCSLPLHIAALHGTEEIVELLLKHGARVDLEARMCFPGPHNQICEMRSVLSSNTTVDRSSERLQSAEYYAIDGDQAEILELLLAQGEDNWLPWQQKRPLLHLACERGAWNCVKYLVAERSEEINQCYDEYYPIHQAALQDLKFLELLIQCGADVTVKTATQQMTVLHVVLLLGKKSAEETSCTLKLLLDHGCRKFINEPDSLSNTPLHGLIVRYALEESRYGYVNEPRPWNKWDMLHLVRYLLYNGSRPSINHRGNSALACVLRHVRDWEFRYELLDMLLQNGGNPNCVGRDGSVPLMVCLVPLINKDPLHRLTHSKKVFYLNSVRLLCKHGANPNCSSISNLTPLHVLVFTASEYITLNREEEKSNAFAFIRQLLIILLQHGLDPNVRFSQRTQHILLALMDMVQNARMPSDLDYVYDLTLTLLQYGANPNTSVITTEPMICHSQSSVFLKKSCHQVLYYYVQLVIRKEELLVDLDQRFARLMWLYYYSMNHRELFTCLKILNTQMALVPVRQIVATILRQMYTEPRTLKQIARVKIYSALNYSVAPNINKLMLPGPLKEYLMEWMP
ncbi:ankyrin-3 [Centruroides vittatus]|uniref:ankyrin-1-like n=1 Tax=Centruroides sculpturatus TaxID=218467 RepID=UPI000C6ECA54|nr:ankyrin-1-like [Centruroides sculpturatus]